MVVRESSRVGRGRDHEAARNLDFARASRVCQESAALLSLAAAAPLLALASTMGLLSVYINNKAGGLIYQKVRSHTPITLHRAHLSELRHRSLTQDFSPHAAKLDVNVHLRLASTFDSLALILKQLSPVRGSSRMELLEADGFVLQSFDTPTGLKFFVTADPDSKRLDEVLIRTYELYSDFVLKDPFYELEMPIRCESFDQKLQKLADDYHRR